MKLIVGLGNPESRYDNTRHNVGFAMLDWYAAAQKITWREQAKFHAVTARTTTAGETIIFAKPTTCYNDCGIAARALIDFYKLSRDDLLVIHDDIVLDFGKVRIRRGGQDAGNNGLKSLHQHIGQAFWHVRIGADNLRRRQIGDVDFVLSEFNRDETQILAEWTAPTVARAIDQFVAGTISATSYRLL